jgi:hypothetical protein
MCSSPRYAAFHVHLHIDVPWRWWYVPLNHLQNKETMLNQFFCWYICPESLFWGQKRVNLIGFWLCCLWYVGMMARVLFHCYIIDTVRDIFWSYMLTSRFVAGWKLNPSLSSMGTGVGFRVSYQGTAWSEELKEKRSAPYVKLTIKLCSIHIRTTKYRNRIRDNDQCKHN